MSECKSCGGGRYDVVPDVGVFYHSCICGTEYCQLSTGHKTMKVYTQEEVQALLRYRHLECELITLNNNLIELGKRAREERYNAKDISEKIRKAAWLIEEAIQMTLDKLDYENNKLLKDPSDYE